MAKTDKGQRIATSEVHYYMTSRGLASPPKPLGAPRRLSIGSSATTAEDNGSLAFSVRDAAEECQLAKDTAGPAFKELVALGLHRVRDGQWRHRRNTVAEQVPVDVAPPSNKGVEAIAIWRRLQDDRGSTSERSTPLSQRRPRVSEKSKSRPSDGTDTFTSAETHRKCKIASDEMAPLSPMTTVHIYIPWVGDPRGPPRAARPARGPHEAPRAHGGSPRRALFADVPPQTQSAYLHEIFPDGRPL